MIDIKELRVGSHYYNTSYVKPVIGRITAINGNDRVSLCYDMPLDPDNDPFEGAMVHDLEPIPITAELLEELGFEVFGQYYDVSVWNKGNIHIGMFGERMAAQIGHSEISVRYLHELEAFVYLTTEQELIKED